ncbi:MAG TPA: hypothetical protein VKU01_09960 [Bryobacteraceae bacterium]|nr:hypothetical protein [Bryobacteraceae bacterium]
MGTLIRLTPLLFAAAVVCQTPPSPEPYTVPEAYEVYSALLPQDWMITAAHADPLVFQAETKPYKICLEPEASSKELVGPAIADYVKVNQKQWLLRGQFHIQPLFQIVPAEQLSNVLKIYHSVGWVELSAVGFNAEKTVAVVYIGHHCGGLCGGGGFHVLEKKDGKWQPLKWRGSSCFWAS